MLNFPSTKVKFKDQIIINVIEDDKKSVKPKKIELDIVYEDNDILLINKPKGMVVHPGAGNHEKTLVNALLFKYKKIIRYERAFKTRHCS